MSTLNLLRGLRGLASAALAGVTSTLNLQVREATWSLHEDPYLLEMAPQYAPLGFTGYLEGISGFPNQGLILRYHENTKIDPNPEP